MQVDFHYHKCVNTWEYRSMLKKATFLFSLNCPYDHLKLDSTLFHDGELYSSRMCQDKHADLVALTLRGADDSEVECIPAVLPQ